MGASALKMTLSHCEVIAKAIQCPALVLLADQGFGADHDNVELLSRVSQSLPHLTFEIMPATHHWHMDEAPAAVIADNIQSFNANN